MNRRNMLQSMGCLAIGPYAVGRIDEPGRGFPLASEAQDGQRPAQTTHSMEGYGIPGGPPQQVAMLIYPQMTALDLVGPNQILAALGNISVRLVSSNKEPVTTDSGMVIQPHITYRDCPDNLTVLFVPGGAMGTLRMMSHKPTLEFLAEKGRNAKYVTSVCTGSMILAAAGLLKGYRATSHWSVRDLLSGWGATPVEDRVVIDRNRITGAGVTAGLDFGLRLAAQLRNPLYAKALQLGLEYDPKPPYSAGNPKGAGEEVTAMMRAMYAPVRAGMSSLTKK